MVRSIQFVLMGLICTLAAGCSAYIGDYEYAPRPAVAEVRPSYPPSTQPTGAPVPAPAQAQQAPPAMAVLASIIGVHREDGDLKIPDSVEVQVRIDNNGPDTVVFDPQSLELVSAQITPFAPVIARPPQPLTLNPQQTTYVTAYFPFPGGRDYDEVDMSSLSLRWRVQIGGQMVAQNADFHRIWPYYYRPYPYYYYSPYYAYPAYPVVRFGFVYRR